MLRSCTGRRILLRTASPHLPLSGTLRHRHLFHPRWALPIHHRANYCTDTRLKYLKYPPPLVYRKSTLHPPETRPRKLYLRVAASHPQRPEKERL